MNEDSAQAFEPTVVSESGLGDAAAAEESGPSVLDQRVVEAAIRRGLISAIQGTRLLEQAGGEAGATAGGALGSLVAKGLVSPEVARDLEDEVKNDLVPGYRVVGELGRGGMGVVYKAVQKRLDRPVALKVVTPAQAGDAAYLRRFQQEALALGRLNHPNIVQVYDYGEAHGKVYLALELVQGDDAARVLKAEGPFPEARALRVGLESALGLSHALEAGIIHRDVKPANLMLVQAARDARGEGALVTKVTDLGLARLAERPGGDGPEAAELTKAGTILGSPAYMAPEQTRGEPADFRSDVYALGATLYHLLTGKAPYADTSVVKVLVKKQTEQLDDPRDAGADVREATVRVLDRMLARPPEARYGSYAELIADLEALLAGGEPATPWVAREASSLRVRPPAPRSLTGRVLDRVGAGGGGQASPARSTGRLDGAAAGPGADGAGARGGALAGAAVVGLLVLALVAVALALGSGGGPAPGAGSGAGSGAQVTDPGPLPPTDPTTDPGPGPAVTAEERRGAVERTLDALARLAPAERLDLATVRETAADLAALRPTEARPLRLRLASLVGQGLEQVLEERAARLEALAAAADWAALAGEVDAALAPYRAIDRAPPPRLAALVDLAGKAGADGGAAGQAERAAWTAADALTDARAAADAWEAFTRDFAWSPRSARAKDQAAERAAQAPRVTVTPVPADAVLFLDGERLGQGAWTGRVLAGARTFGGEAAGHFVAERAVQVAADTREVRLRLDPKPARPLAQDPVREIPAWRPQQPLLTQWKIEGGEWSARPEVAGLGAAAPEPGRWARARLDLSRAQRLLERGGPLPGWQVQWKVTPPERGTAELRLLASPEGRAVVVGVRQGAVYLGVRAQDGPLEELAALPVTEAPGYYEADWDGRVLVVRAARAFVGSVAVDWTPDLTYLAVAVDGSEAVFRDLFLFGLKATGAE